MDAELRSAFALLPHHALHLLKSSFAPAGRMRVVRPIERNICQMELVYCKQRVPAPLNHRISHRPFFVRQRAGLIRKGRPMQTIAVITAFIPAAANILASSLPDMP